MNALCKDRKRTILHVDMDHFFSAIEERENPCCRGSPVVVGADPKGGRGRGVVKTCNYLARAFGVHSGMPISKAWELCPHATYVRANYELYKNVSVEIMAILRQYADALQQWGLDEAFLDVSSRIEGLGEAIKLAESIKHEILWKEDLTCSVGIAPNKLVAKIASDYSKPDGLTVVAEDHVEGFLAPLPVRKMVGIGEKTERKLNAMGIHTIGGLATSDISVLVREFGVMGSRYHQWAHGIHESEVKGKKRMRKSVGCESTFTANVDDRTLVFKRLDEICQRVYERTVRRNLRFKTITVKIRYGDFQTYTHGRTLPFSTDRFRDLQRTTRALTLGNLHRSKVIRLVGVRVSNLKSAVDRPLMRVED